MTITARKDDITTGICSIDGPQRGSITGSASKVTMEGKLVARVGDIVTAECGHTGTIDENGVMVSAEGSPIARCEDGFTGIYTGTIDRRSGFTNAE